MGLISPTARYLLICQAPEMPETQEEDHGLSKQEMENAAEFV